MNAAILNLDLECANRLAKFMLDYLCPRDQDAYTGPRRVVVLGMSNPRESIIIEVD